MKIKYSDENRIFSLHTDEIPYLSFRMLDDLRVPNLYTTRFLSYDDETESGEEGLRVAVMNFEDMQEASPVVRANRDLLAGQLGSALTRECITDQKHTNYVHVATESDLGLKEKPLRMQFVDGVVTDIPETVLTVFGADCPSVYIADPVHHAIGLVHAGWRGTLGRIPEVAVAQMVVHFGSEPAEMYAAIGPGICRDCYEMGDEVYEAFAEQWSREEADRILSKYPAVDAEGRDIPGGKYHLDLREANLMTLIRAGLRPENIEVSNVCTKCNADVFYSYRARRMENEQAAMMVNRFRL